MAESAQGSTGRIFISYRRDETAYPAGWLYDRLADHYGDGQIFKDVDSIELGDDFVEVITRAVGSCDVLLALIGDQWLTITDEDGQRRLDDPNDFVRLEIEAALTRNVRLIPILVAGARLPRAGELPASLAKLVRRQALELSPGRFDFDISRLVKVLDMTLADVRTAQAGVVSTTGPAGSGPDPRNAALPTAAEAREQAEPGPPTSILPNVRAKPASPSPSDLGNPPDKPPRRLSTRARVLVGAGAFATLLSLLIVIIVVNSETPSTQTAGPCPGVSTFPEVSPARAGSGEAILLASFEDGTEGWLPDPDQGDIGSVCQASDFHTHGSFSLRIDSRGDRELGWYGKNFSSPVDISGKRTVSVDIKTLEVGTQTAIAVQFGDADWTWCQSPEPWDVADAGTDRRTVTLNLAECPDRPASGSDKLNAVWVWFEGKGSFRLDNVRAE
jgi:TIR domain